jgi:hypothetical protein
MPGIQPPISCDSSNRDTGKQPREKRPAPFMPFKNEVGQAEQDRDERNKDGMLKVY